MSVMSQDSNNNNLTGLLLDEFVKENFCKWGKVINLNDLVVTSNKTIQFKICFGPDSGPIYMVSGTRDNPPPELPRASYLFLVSL